MMSAWIDISRRSAGIIHKHDSNAYEQVAKRQSPLFNSKQIQTRCLLNEIYEYHVLSYSCLFDFSIGLSAFNNRSAAYDDVSNVNCCPVKHRGKYEIKI